MLVERRDIELVSLDRYPEAPEVVEDGDTFEKNAVKKASLIAEHTGSMTLSDDSGLEVDALGGAPGVYSARYAGENASDADRIRKLLDALHNTPDAHRTAQFRCAVAVAAPGRETRVVVGVCEGRITRTPRGDLGFGYDPVFVPAGYDKTFGELGAEVKNQMSHRAKALQKAVGLLSN